MQVAMILAAAALLSMAAAVSADDCSNAQCSDLDRSSCAVVQAHGMPAPRTADGQREFGQHDGQPDGRGTSALAATAWIDAAERIVRVVPADIPRLPKSVHLALTARGCTVPQPDFFFDGTVNVIHGNFAGNPTPDHAVLCSVDGVSHIHVVWGGPNGCESEFEARDDSAALQTAAPGRIEYSRLIAATDAPFPSERRSESSEQGAETEALQGIEDIFIDKASTRYYCVRGRWRDAPGAD